MISIFKPNNNKYWDKPMEPLLRFIVYGSLLAITILAVNNIKITGTLTALAIILISISAIYPLIGYTVSVIDLIVTCRARLRKMRKKPKK